MNNSIDENLNKIDRYLKDISSVTSAKVCCIGLTKIFE
jgi:hypothetical protein